MKLYGKYFLIQLKSKMEYKTSFLLTCIGQFLISFHVFLGVYFMFRRFPEVAGFTYEEVLLCFGITLLEFSLAEAVARGFDCFSGIIRQGEFDRIMVRPRNEILQVLGSRMEFTRIGRMLQAVVMFSYGVTVSHITWNFPKVMTLLFMLIGGTAVFSGIFLLKDWKFLIFSRTEQKNTGNILYPFTASGYCRYALSSFPIRWCSIIPLLSCLTAESHGTDCSP